MSIGSFKVLQGPRPFLTNNNDDELVNANVLIYVLAHSAVRNRKKCNSKNASGCKNPLF